MRIRGGVVAGCAIALVLATSAFAGSLGHLISKGSNRGPLATAKAVGPAVKPRALYVKVTSRPHQKVLGLYEDLCLKNGNGGTKGDQFRGRTPLVVKLKHRFRRPDHCNVTAGAQLTKKGRITVRLYAKSWG